MHAIDDTHIRKTTNKLNRNDNTAYQTREHWKLLNSNENTNQSCTRPSGSCRIGLYFHSRSTISNTHSFGMWYYTSTVGSRYNDSRYNDNFVITIFFRISLYREPTVLASDWKTKKMCRVQK